MTFDPVIWGTVSDWIVVATAAAGVWFGVSQLRGLKLAQQHTSSESRAQVAFTRAQLLLDIDREFESDAMQQSRIAIRGLRNTVHEKLGKADGPDFRTREELQSEQARAFAEDMNELWARSKGIDAAEAAKDTSTKSKLLEQYNERMRLVNWMETVGFLCRRNLLPTADVIELYDAAIIPTIRNMIAHIRHRREEPPYPNADFHANAEWLFEQALAHQKKREEPTPVPPSSKSNLNWS